MDIIKELHNYGLVPVIKITDVNNAVPLAKALADGGLLLRLQRKCPICSLVQAQF